MAKGREREGLGEGGRERETEGKGGRRREGGRGQGSDKTWTLTDFIHTRTRVSRHGR